MVLVAIFAVFVAMLLVLVADVGGVGFDIVIGSFQLGTVNRILTGGLNRAIRNIGDYAGSWATRTMSSAVFAFGLVPLQGVFIKYSERSPYVIFATIF